jgi:uncharacterized damage-inducible protein DinB
MTICQTLLQDFDAEMKGTRTLLERVPEQLSTYKPHEKSMALDALATHVADIPCWFRFALEKEHFHLPADYREEPAATRDALLQKFDESVAIGREWIDRATDADMARDWTFTYGDSFKMTEPRTVTVRSFLNHLVHHRAQLGVYLRLLNVPIPGMYGPSADEHFQP